MPRGPESERNVLSGRPTLRFCLGRIRRGRSGPRQFSRLSAYDLLRKIERVPLAQRAGSARPALALLRAEGVGTGRLLKDNSACERSKLAPTSAPPALAQYSREADSKGYESVGCNTLTPPNSAPSYANRQTRPSDLCFGIPATLADRPPEKVESR